MDRVADLFALNKFERIQEMQRWGLNTPDYVFFQKGKLRELLHWANAQGFPWSKRISVRLFADKEDEAMGKPPHFPNVEWSAALVWAGMYIQEYHVMIMTEQINPALCEAAGTMMLELHGINGFGISIFEYRLGPGTVREALDGPELQHLECNLHEFPKDPVSGVYLKELALAKVEALRFPWWNRCIFEWSYYRRPHGWKPNRLIFWEVRRRK